MPDLARLNALNLRFFNEHSRLTKVSTIAERELRSVLF